MGRGKSLPGGLRLRTYFVWGDELIGRVGLSAFKLLQFKSAFKAVNMRACSLQDF